MADPVRRSGIQDSEQGGSGMADAEQRRDDKPPTPAAAGAPADRASAPDAEYPLELPRPDDWTPPSWEDVVRLHSARVYRLAYRLTGDPHDAEDLTQEVFVRVFRSLSSYTPGTFEGWLHRITTNLFLDTVRRKARIRFEGLAEDAPDRLAGREPSPSQAYDDRHLDADVQAALDALPPDFRAAVVLCDIEGLSYEEIAATLGVKLGTVRSRIHRGRAQLRAALGHRAPMDRHTDSSSSESDHRPVAPVSGAAS
jgi:RNA polymerase sigma factor (sigma-70 family)